MKKNIIRYIALYLLIVIALILLVPSAKPLLKDPSNTTYKDIVIFSLGDSLTEGVGDEITSGGYVNYLSDSIKEEHNLNLVTTYNYGKSGDKTTQLIDRIKKDKNLQKDLKKASIITLTIGGNDLMKVVKENIFKDLTKETFVKPREEYLKNLKELYTTIRKYSNSPIYQLGIYNPFYLNFKELVEMQEIVNEWNAATENFKFENSYFIPINDAIYKGQGIEGKDVNDLLSKDDSFHPNNTGYQIISKEFKEKINETSSKWLEEVSRWKNILNK